MANQTIDLGRCQEALKLAALGAWKAVHHFHRGEFTVYEKEGDGPATDADRLADDHIRRHLEGLIPESLCGFLTEESLDDTSRLDRPYCWIIDPIDGTNEFIRGGDDFAMHLALAGPGEDGSTVPLVSVVYHPFDSILHNAIRGHGAYASRIDLLALGKSLHWWESDSITPEGVPFQAPQRLSVSSQAESSLAVMSISSARMGPKTEKFYREVVTRGLAGQVVRRSSLGIKAADIAMGIVDFHLTTQPGRAKEWDLCAPELLVTEAGGRVTDLSGKPLKYNQPDPVCRTRVVLSNSSLHPLLVERLADLNT